MPICTPTAPSVIAAAMLEPFIIPPAAIIGVEIVCLSCASRLNIPVIEFRQSPIQVPRCPPASDPWAMIKSTSKSSACFPSLTEVTDTVVKIPAAFMASTSDLMGSPK